MGLFDGAFDTPMSMGGGILPSWLVAIQHNPELLQGLKSILGGAPQPPDALPPNAQPASLAPQPAMGDPRASIFDHPDSAPGGPQINGAPPMGAQPMGAPMPPQQQAPGMGAMAQAPQQSQSPMGGFGSSLMDFGKGLLMGQGTVYRDNAVKALVAQGVPQDKAYIAVNAPNAGQLSGVLDAKTKPQWGVIGHDQVGNAQYGFVDPGKMSVTPYQQSGGNQTGIDPTLTGDEFLKTLPPGMASQVKAIVEGRQAPPGSFALKSPMVQQLLQAAGQYEPGFDLTKWSQRVAGNKDFYGGGKSSEMVRAANQTIHHVGALVDSMDKLGNTQYPMANTVKNAFDQKIMGGGAVTEFLPNAHAVAEEMSKVFKGANLSDAEIRQWEASLNQDMSPEQQKAAVGKLITLLNGSLEALENKRRASLGDALSDQKGPLLDAKSEETMKKVAAWISGQKPDAAAPAQATPAAPAAQTATGPNGQKVILQNGQWVPMK